MNWLKRVFGFANVNSEVDASVANEIMKNTSLKMIKDANEKVKSIVEETMKLTEASKNNSGGTIENHVIYDGILKCSVILRDIIKNSILSVKSLRMHQVWTNIDTILDKGSDGGIVIAFPSVFSNLKDNDYKLTTALTYIELGIKDNIPESELRERFNALLSSFVITNDSSPIFDFTLDIHQVPELYSKMLINNRSYMFAKIIDDTVPIELATERIRNYKVRSRIETVWGYLQDTMLKEDLDSEDKIKMMTKFINAMTRLFQIENATITTAVYSAVLVEFGAVIKNIEEAIIELHDEEAAKLEPAK